MRTLNSGDYLFQDKTEDANYYYYFFADEAGRILFMRIKKDESELRIIRARKDNYASIWANITSQTGWKRIFE